MNWRPKEGWDVSDVYYAKFGERKDRVMPSELIEAGADAILELVKSQGVRLSAGDYPGEQELLKAACLHVKAGKGSGTLAFIPDKEAEGEQETIIPN